MADPYDPLHFRLELSEPYPEEPIDITSYTDVAVIAVADWERPPWPLKFEGLDKNNDLRGLFIKAPCSVTLDLSDCNKLGSLHLEKCVSDSMLQLGANQKYLHLKQCDLNGISQTDKLISLQLEGSKIIQPVFLPDYLERLEIDNSSIVPTSIPRVIDYLRLVNPGEESSTRILEKLTGSHPIKVSGGLDLISTSLVHSIDLEEHCHHLSIMQCPLGPEFRLNGQFDHVNTNNNGQEDYFFGRCGEKLSSNDMVLLDKHSTDSIIEFAKHCKELYTTLDGELSEFPDLSDTKLELLSLTTSNHRIPLDYLPESLITIELNYTSYNKTNGGFPSEFVEQYCQ